RNGAPGLWPGATPESADDLAVLLLALRFGHHHHSLALARVLTGTAATGAGTRTLALALVDARALHLVATRLVLGTGLHRTAGKERGRRRGDQDALAHSIHRLLLVSPHVAERVIIGLQAWTPYPAPGFKLDRSATPSGRQGVEGGAMRRLETSRRRAETWLVPLVLACAIAATDSNGLHVPFGFHDWHTIEQNPAIRSLLRIPSYFVDPDTTTILHENKDLRPLLLVTMALNYRLSGLEPWSYHVVNLLLHWIVTLLVFRIVRDHLWLGDDVTPVALGAALIVALHPPNTEPVNYVSARPALLTAAFYLAAFDAGARDRPVRCVLLAACAMLTKSIAVSLPLVVLVHRLFDR